MGTKLVGDHLSRGTKFVWYRLSRGTKLFGDHLSMGTEFLGTICPLGQEVGDRKSRDQMGSGPNESQPYLGFKCDFKNARLHRGNLSSAAVIVISKY